jgi:hypothetical protein
VELYLKIRNGLYSHFFEIFFQNKFKYFGNKSRIVFPLNLNGIENITTGDVFSWPINQFSDFHEI